MLQYASTDGWQYGKVSGSAALVDNRLNSEPDADDEKGERRSVGKMKAGPPTI